MVLKVTDLADGDARAAYKNVSLDLRQYKKMIMDIHAEALPEETLKDGEPTAFIRIGSDYTNNFYEYEVPLVITEPGKYSTSVDEDRKVVWPEENKMEIELDVFTDVKLARNEARRAANSTIELTTIFEAFHGNNRVLIRGNPSLSNIRTIMLGVRNPKRTNYLQETNDGYEKSGEIWVNELRVTDFRDKSGWAANARMRMNLADFGTLSIAGAASTPGFGSIEQKVNERDQEDVRQYDIATNLELGKFFPEKAKVSIPLYMGYSKTTITPEYNPIDPDVLLDDAPLRPASRDETGATELLTVSVGDNLGPVFYDPKGEKQNV
jgi:cell surface protein SprA